MATKELMHKCGVFCRRPVVAFVMGTTLSFPLEHALYHYIWPFTLIASWLGL